MAQRFFRSIALTAMLAAALAVGAVGMKVAPTTHAAPVGADSLAKYHLKATPTPTYHQPTPYAPANCTDNRVVEDTGEQTFRFQPTGYASGTIIERVWLHDFFTSGGVDCGDYWTQAAIYCDNGGGGFCNDQQVMLWNTGLWFNINQKVSGYTCQLAGLSNRQFWPCNTPGNSGWVQDCTNGDAVAGDTFAVNYGLDVITNHYINNGGCYRPVGV